MATIPFTDREMQRAWRANLTASEHSTRSNAHRLLLFYAVECGLKAVLMKRKSLNSTSDCQDIAEAQHNINKLLDNLSADQSLKLPNQFNISCIHNKGSKQERKLNPGKINQVWRYGGQVENMMNRNGNSVSFTDQILEDKLIQISNWIKGELR